MSSLAASIPVNCFQSFKVTTMSFTCGDGSVILSLEDGSVTYQNCDPAESGKAFWNAVAESFPAVKEAIKKL